MNKQKSIMAGLTILIFSLLIVEPVFAATGGAAVPLNPQDQRVDINSSPVSTALISLSFDDEDQSVYNAGYPILSMHDIPATFYFVTRYLTDQWQIQLRDLQAHGWEIGSHTVNHYDLTTLSDSQVDYELSQSKADLEAAGLTVTGLSYPFGVGCYHPAIVQKVAQYYEYGRSTTPGYNSSPLNPYALQAMTQSSYYPLATMKSWIDTAIANKQWLIIFMHRVDNSGDAYSISPSDLTLLADYIQSKVNAGSLRAVTMSEGFNSYNSPSPTTTFTPTSTATNTFTPTATFTSTPTATNTFTPTATFTPTSTLTDTFTPTATFTPTPTVTDTFTPTATFTPTSTATNTFIPTATFTPTPTVTNTFTPTATFTPTSTATNTFTPTATFTPTPTATNTFTPTATFTPTSTTTNTATLPPTPASPTSLYAAVISKSQVNLSWTDNANNETGFRIERCKGSACTNFNLIATVGVNITSYSDGKLNAYTTYRYRIYAYNAGGRSAYSNMVTVTTSPRR